MHCPPLFSSFLTVKRRFFRYRLSTFAATKFSIPDLSRFYRCSQSHFTYFTLYLPYSIHIINKKASLRSSGSLRKIFCVNLGKVLTLHNIFFNARMKQVTYEGLTFEPYITREAINARIAELGKDITRDCAGKCLCFLSF